MDGVCGMSGEKIAAIDMQGASIPFFSPGMGILIPPNSRELEMCRNGTDTLREGVF